jgi:predicted regulator of amino acid metabolism with ACT domain
MAGGLFFFMTTKEIAQAVGKDERTVRRWVNRVADKMSGLSDKMSDAERTKKPADYTLEETIAIIEAGLGKNAAGIFRANTEKPAIDTVSITAIIRETITAMVPVLVEVVRGAIPQQQVTALPAPVGLSQRDQLRRVINEYAHRSGDHAGAWRELYTEFYYRYHRNIRECARNREMDTLDYVENEGIMDELLSLAISLYGQQKEAV